MSFFENLFKKNNTDGYALVSAKDIDIQGNEMSQTIQASLIDMTLKKREAVKEIITELDNNYSNCFYKGKFNKYIDQDATIFIETLGNITPKYSFKCNDKTLATVPLLLYIMMFYPHLDETDKTILKGLIENIVQKIKNIPSDIYLIQLCVSKFSNNFIEKMTAYFDINATNENRENVLFHISTMDQFKAVYDKNKDKINLKQKNIDDNNFIQFYIKQKNDLLGNKDFINKLPEFHKLGLQFDEPNKLKYKILNLALAHTKIDFAIELSKLDFIDFTIDTADPKNWFHLILNHYYDIKHKITILRNINKLNKLHPSFLIKFVNIYINEYPHSKLYNDLLLIIEEFVLNFSQDNYKQFFEYVDNNNDGNTVIHKLASIRHKLALRFIMEHTNIEFTKNKAGEYPIDVYNNNKLETLLAKNNKTDE